MMNDDAWYIVDDRWMNDRWRMIEQWSMKNDGSWMKNEWEMIDDARWKVDDRGMMDDVDRS